MSTQTMQKTNGKSNIIFFRLEANEIHQILLDIGMRPNLNGFIYIAYSLELIRENPELLEHITKGLYIDLAKHFRTTPSSVERAMRHAVTVTWLRGDRLFLKHIFASIIHSENYIPSNTVFLAGLYHYLEGDLPFGQAS